MPIWTWKKFPQNECRSKESKSGNFTLFVYPFWWGLWLFKPWMKPGCISTIQKQSNCPWNGNILALQGPRSFGCKNLPEKYSLRFLGFSWGNYGWLSRKAQIHNRRILLKPINNATRKNCGHEGETIFQRVFNAPTHKSRIAMNTIHALGFKTLNHPPYSPDLAPSDYCLLAQLIKPLKDIHFFKQRDNRGCGDLKGDYVD